MSPGRLKLICHWAAIIRYGCRNGYKPLTAGEGDMTLRDLQDDRSFARRFIRTGLSAKMVIALFGNTATHEADGLRKPTVISIKTEHGSMS
jgi:hypothetical protein